MNGFTPSTNLNEGRRLAAAMTPGDRVRADFPALEQRVNGAPLVYLDSAATALKPRAVIDAVVGVYARDCANIHRGAHALAERATEAFEHARELARGFLGAPAAEEIIFLRGTTEATNLVAQSYARPRLRAGDEILITELEHHSNIVPWQLVCEQTGARLVVVPVNELGEVELEAVEARLSPRTRLVAVAHVSNALGTVLPVREIVELARQRGARVFVDGAQAAPHLPVNVREIGCDFYAFSGHKAYGPTGVGVLYGRQELLADMPPYQGGGDMIESVSFEHTRYQRPPYRFEAGTPNIAGTIGLGAAIHYLHGVGFGAIQAREQALLAYGTARLEHIPGLRMIGRARQKVGVLSFTVDGIHAHDLGTIADSYGVAIRTGHLCAQPVVKRFGAPALARASLGVYSRPEDIDALVESVLRAKELFS